MRTGTSLLITTVLLTLAFSCSKKEQAPAVPATTDTSKVVTTPPVVPASIYPYTDTYSGSYSDRLYPYGTGSHGGTSTQLVDFHVVYLNATQVVFSCKLPFLSSVTINDTFVKNASGLYLAVRVKGLDEYREPLDVDTLRMDAGLYFTWAYRYWMCSDYDDHYCKFEGVKTSK